MTKRLTFSLALSPLALALASCGVSANGDSGQATRTPAPAGATTASLATEAVATYDEPWAAAFAPGTNTLFVTEKAGTIRFIDVTTRREGAVTGVPEVDYGGQGGLGDIAFLPSETGSSLARRTIYLSWVEAGEGDTRGAAVGRGTLMCGSAEACRIDDLRVIWRQDKVTGRGHYAHRLAFSPDGQHLFVASGDRQKMQPAQDTANNLGSVVRLNLDGTPAAGNPLAGQAGRSPDIWSWGHRNILGIDFDAQGQLWVAEHGPAGGDEFNLIRQGQNYGWPVVSEGDHYGREAVPRHATRPEFAAPAVAWTPVIAPGDMLFYRGDMFGAWRGQAIIATMKPAGLVRVAVNGSSAREVARHPMDNRIRSIVEGSDGTLWLLEDGDDARLLRLTPG